LASTTVSAPSAELTVRSPAARPDATAGAWRQWRRGGRLLIALSVLALIAAAASLAIPSTPSYDPWSWLVWGREIIHANLHTAGGPSWKPLPMLFTTIFAVFGSAAPDLWLVVARAGALMAAVMALRLAFRFTAALAPPREELRTRRAGRALLASAPLIAGLIAAGSLLNSPGFISDNALGYSEGLATAMMLGAVDRFMDARRRQAFVLGFFAALDRPELWIFWVPFGVYLAWRDAGARRLVGSLFVLTLALWFLPSWIVSGHPFQAVTRAQHPRANSLAFAASPFSDVLREEAWPTLLNRVKIPAILAILAALVGLWRIRAQWWGQREVSATTKARAMLAAVGLFGFAWWIGIALETQLGFSGNDRYLVLGTAPVAIAGGIAWGWAALAAGRGARWLTGRLGALRAAVSARAASVGSLAAGSLAAAAVFLAVPPWIANNVISLPRTHAALVYQAHLREDAAAIVHHYGAHHLLTCGNGRVMTEGFQVPMLAWYLHVRTLRIEDQPPDPDAPAPWPSVILQDRDTRAAELLPTWQTIGHWESLGARYRIVGWRTFRVFLDCRK
jgi:hypothetical protein